MWFLAPLLSTAVGAVQGKQKRDAQRKYNLGQAEMTRYSPWTGKSGTISPETASPLSGAMQGAMGGINLAQNLMGKGSSWFGGGGGGGQPSPGLTSQDIQAATQQATPTSGTFGSNVQDMYGGGAKRNWWDQQGSGGRNWMNQGMYSPA